MTLVVVVVVVVVVIFLPANTNESILSLSGTLSPFSSSREIVSTIDLPIISSAFQPTNSSKVLLTKTIFPSLSTDTSPSPIESSMASSWAFASSTSFFF
jgi:hypothetical protein